MCRSSCCPASAPRTSPAQSTAQCQSSHLEQKLFSSNLKISYVSKCESLPLSYWCSVKQLSQQMSLMDTHPMYSQNIYTHFVYSFLLHHNTSGEYTTEAVHSQVIQSNVCTVVISKPIYTLVNQKFQIHSLHEH